MIKTNFTLVHTLFVLGKEDWAVYNTAVKNLVAYYLNLTVVG
jgi:hypothetical protein